MSDMRRLEGSNLQLFHLSVTPKALAPKALAPKAVVPKAVAGCSPLFRRGISDLVRSWEKANLSDRPKMPIT